MSRVIDNFKSFHCRKILESLRVYRLKVTSFSFLKSDVPMQHLNLAKRLNFMIAIHLYFVALMFVSITFWMVCQAPDFLWSKLGPRMVFRCTSWWEHLTDPTLVAPHLQYCNITKVSNIFFQITIKTECPVMKWWWCEVRQSIDGKSIVTNIVRISHRSFITIANMNHWIITVI